MHLTEKKLKHYFLNKFVTRFKLFLYIQQTAPKSAVCFAFVFLLLHTSLNTFWQS